MFCQNFNAKKYIMPGTAYWQKKGKIKQNKIGNQEKIDEIKTIEFDHVTFIYPNTEKIILNDVSFKFNDNEKISIVGLNGAGKTTIVKLLCRLYEPVSGTIKINGIDIKEYEKENYIKQISAVFQDYKLFAYSIKENIDPFNQKDVVEISKKVGIHDKISSLPHKYDSLIGKSYDIVRAAPYENCGFLVSFLADDS